MLFHGLECVLDFWNAIGRVGIPSYVVGMLSRGLECFRQSWNTVVHGGNSF
jgi:hypothetical protein